MFSAVGEVLFNMTYRTPHHQQFKQCRPFQTLSLWMNRYRGVLKRTWKEHLPIKVVNEFLPLIIRLCMCSSLLQTSIAARQSLCVGRVIHKS